MGRPLAIVTGASTGIGYELARCCAEDGFDLIVAADEPEIKKAAADFAALGAKVDAVDNEGNTALILTAERVNPKVLEALMSEGQNLII